MNRYFNFNLFRRKCSHCNHSLLDYKQIIAKINEIQNLNEGLLHIKYYCDKCGKKMDLILIVTNYKTVYFIN